MNRIKELRKEKGLSQAELAKALFVNQTAVSQWERGATMPSPNMLNTLADYFHVTTDYLLGRDASDDGGQKEKAPAGEPAEADVEAAKVALFGGDGEVTDEMWEEALFAAQLIKERYRRKKDE